MEPINNLDEFIIWLRNASTEILHDGVYIRESIRVVFLLRMQNRVELRDHTYLTVDWEYAGSQVWRAHKRINHTP